MADLKELNVKRGQLKGQLTRFISFLAKFDETKIVELQTRLERIEQFIKEFNEIQSRIEIISDEGEVEEVERELFEEQYYKAVATARQYVLNCRDQIQVQLLNANVQGESKSNMDTSNVMHNRMHGIGAKLPKIGLPKFYGDYEKWGQFYDSFTTLVHNDTSLDDIQKFYYLLDCLKGEAENVVLSLEITRENYATAWNLLKKRFENKPVIINAHLKALFDMPELNNESHSLLRKLLDDLLRHIRALKTLGEPIEFWDRILIFMIGRKLDKETKKEWEEKTILSFKGLPTLDNFTDFLGNRCRILETVEPAKSSKFIKRREERLGCHVTIQNQMCEMCDGAHFIYRCEKLWALPNSARREEIKRLKLCLNCLRPGHFVTDCRAKGCKKCNGRHNSMLHNDVRFSKWKAPANNAPGEEDVEAVRVNVTSEVEGHSLVAATSSVNANTVLLSTAVLFIKDASNNLHKCRALLDCGSQTNFITQKLLNTLRLRAEKICIPVLGVNQAITKVNKRVQASIKSIYNNFTIDLSFLVLENITADLPTSSFNDAHFEIPQNINLADPKFNVMSEIDMLLGAGVFYDLLCAGQIRLGPGQPTLQKSVLGWIIAGHIMGNRSARNHEPLFCNLVVTQNVQDQLERFWAIEECSQERMYSSEEIECERIFVNTVTREASGKFVVTLPLREPFELGDSLEGATKRFYALERKFVRNPEFKKKYCAFMNEYRDLRHMTKVEIGNEQKSTNHIYYLPHHGVANETSSTTKLRVVFDASAKTSNGTSLNDNLLVGPNIQDELFSILLRFRKHNVAITSDICKMYRMVNVTAGQRDMQRIVWRTNPNEELEHYRLNTVTYGTASASFLATRCLRQIAIEHEHISSTINKTIVNDFYVDDLLTGAENSDRAITIATNISQILSTYGFKLRKWASNEPKFLEAMSKNEGDTSEGYLVKSDDPKKTLGVFWNATSDILEYVLQSKQIPRVTKRSMLSIVAQIFDPLGLVGPVTVRAKIMLQRLWQLRLDWDDPVPLGLHTEWREFYEQLFELNNLKIPRRVLVSSVTNIDEIHGFCDASEAAYGACLYVRSTNGDGKVTVRLLCAKSRVAPLKSISLPRLELCGAVLVSRLMSKALKALDTNVNNIRFWCDSTIVLAWLAEQPSTWKSFVATRVAEIQNSCGTGQWNHVVSNENPADVISRGISPNRLSEQRLWWEGPHWLGKNPVTWPKSSYERVKHVPDHRKARLTCTIVISDTSIFLRFSSLYKLQRVVAWCMRFFKNTTTNKHSKKIGILSIDELEETLMVLLKIMQMKEYEKEIVALEKLKSLPHNSTIRALDPFLDENRIIRVGGRLRKSGAPYGVKFPIVLPQKHALTRLIIRDQHHKQLHAGPQAILASLRQRFWPINGRREVRSVLARCITCFKFKARVAAQKMGDLPRDRVTPVRPFSICGIDYAGPFDLKDGKLRNRAMVKAYLCLFICFCTKALHIELAGDLSTNSFLNCLKRFISRRGFCKRIVSDNATNFVGAMNELKRVNEFLASLGKNSDISSFCKHNGIEWSFIPPRSPHQGGIWEAAIKSAKYHLTRIVGNSKLTFEEMSTVLAQVEAVLNSRPITPLSSNPNDLQALTPGHFLIGDSLMALPQRDVREVPTNRLHQYQLLQRMVQHFWSRWSQEYLCTLQQRSKWNQLHTNIQVGALVLLKDENAPPLNWRMGRVVEVHPGSDNLIRVISIKTASGVVKRAVQRVCVLPVGEE